MQHTDCSKMSYMHREWGPLSCHKFHLDWFKMKERKNLENLYGKSPLFKKNCYRFRDTSFFGGGLRCTSAFLIYFCIIALVSFEKHQQGLRNMYISNGKRVKTSTVFWSNYCLIYINDPGLLQQQQQQRCSVCRNVHRPVDRQQQDGAAAAAAATALHSAGAWRLRALGPLCCRLN